MLNVISCHYNLLISNVLVFFWLISVLQARWYLQAVYFLVCPQNSAEIFVIVHFSKECVVDKQARVFFKALLLKTLTSAQTNIGAHSRAKFSWPKSGQNKWCVSLRIQISTRVIYCQRSLGIKCFVAVVHAIAVLMSLLWSHHLFHNTCWIKVKPSQLLTHLCVLFLKFLSPNSFVRVKQT